MCLLPTTTTNSTASTACPDARADPPMQALLLAPSYLQLAYKVSSTVTLPDGTTHPFEGLEGFDRDCLTIFLEASPVHADQAATKPSEKPPVTAIRVVRAFQQCQVRGVAGWQCVEWSGLVMHWWVPCQPALP